MESGIEGECIVGGARKTDRTWAIPSPSRLRRGRNALVTLQGARGFGDLFATQKTFKLANETISFKMRQRPFAR